jgi:hypothetical protein
MRNLTRAACLSLALAAAGGAYARELEAVPPAPQSPGVQNPSAIRSVTVRDMGSLPPAARAQIGAAVSQTSQDDLRQLRGAIDSTPMATLALKARGMSSAEIIAAALDDDGELTLIAQETI